MVDVCGGDLGKCLVADRRCQGRAAVAVDPLPDHAVGVVCTIKAVERALIEAATTGSRSAALRALAIHPLVDSVAVAGRLLQGYEARLPEPAYLRA